jgi:hypothetical protein
MLNAFADAVIHKRPPQAGADDMIENTKLLTRIRVASQEA